jgi:hypothetical protein
VDLEGKDHYASYNNVIGRVKIYIILCSHREGMASSGKEDFISKTSTNCSHTSLLGLGNAIGMFVLKMRHRIF